MNYRITHRTAYRYSQPVAFCKNQLRMQPITGGNLQCRRSEITITPEPSYRDEYFDYFGNRVLTFSIEAMHNSLIVESQSELTVQDTGLAEDTPSPPWETLLESASGAVVEPNVDQHRYRSPRITPEARYLQYAITSFQPGGSIVAATVDLIKRMHSDFRYDSNATTVSTTTEEAFGLRAGVCQDFAHVGIACVRSLGLAARYVSGYLRTIPPPGKERLVGADESHAWLEVYCGSELGWIGLDPTNACLVQTDHIPVSVGRDYDDISPMRGVILGGGKHTLSVSVDVRPVETLTKR
ncbi:MAG: transglutaminase family protein [Planctomycetota bacterium]